MSRFVLFLLDYYYLYQSTMVQNSQESRCWATPTHSSVRLHRSLICLLSPAHFVHALLCTHLFTHSLMGKGFFCLMRMPGFHAVSNHSSIHLTSPHLSSGRVCLRSSSGRSHLHHHGCQRSPRLDGWPSRRPSFVSGKLFHPGLVDN